MGRRITQLALLSLPVLTVVGAGSVAAVQERPLDAQRIGAAAGTNATTKNGVVRIEWPRSDVPVKVDGFALKPFAGLGSWAAFMPTPQGAMMMGDTVVFQDEVTPAMDAAFANGLDVTALHNHFFFDEPKVFFMHIGGQGDPDKLARGVKAVWDAIKNVRANHPTAATGFGGPAPQDGKIDAAPLEKILDRQSQSKDGVVKVSVGREGVMHSMKVGEPMGLNTWAAFSGSDDLAVVDGDFIMTAEEVQPVLRALRQSGIHIVALHNHMVGEQPAFYFLHFWGKGSTRELAQAVRSALDAQSNVSAKREGH